MLKDKLLLAAGVGVIAAMAFLYFAPKIKPAKEKTITVTQKQKGVRAAVYPPPQVNMPNNASKPPEIDYLGMDFAGATFRRR